MTLLLFRPINKLYVTLSNVRLNEHLLTLAKSVTYFGIEIEENLSWNNQIEVLAKRLSRTNGILSKLRYYIPTETLTSIWFNNLMLYILKENYEDFFLQKRCIRLVTFSEFQEHTTPIFKNFNLLKLLGITKFNTRINYH